MSSLRSGTQGRRFRRGTRASDCPRAAGASGRSARRAQPASPARHSSSPGTGRRPWTQRQQKLALIYNEQGLRPAEIAHKLGVSTYTVTQIILSAKNRAKG